MDPDATMQIPSIASIIKLHRQSAGPLSFSPAALRALDALAPATPGVSVAFDVDEGGTPMPSSAAAGGNSWLL